MKLRIQGNSLRLRLTRSEVVGLHRNGVIEETTQFSIGGSLTYRIQRRASIQNIQAEVADRTITVYVPAGALDAWATSDDVGLAARDGVLKIAIEKDFRCLTRPREEEGEADAYPHPAERANS
jgi:hypothetical protein